MLQNGTQLNKLKNKFRGKSLNMIMEKRKRLQIFENQFSMKNNNFCHESIFLSTLHILTLVHASQLQFRFNSNRAKGKLTGYFHGLIDKGFGEWN